MHWRDNLPEWYIQKYGIQPCVNIGTAGHVDHGKTTLVEAITGIWTSAHSEELRRGITIKVGYADAAFYKCNVCKGVDSYSTSNVCPNCGNKTELLRVVSFVDSPGHESLMANMLSGAALMNGAMLVIAANEQFPKPQTREHLVALKILSIKNIVVVQNKVDLVSKEDAIANYKAIKAFLENNNIEAPIIPISAQQKINIDALIYALEEFIPTPTRDPSLSPIMHVLRSFDINKPGTRPKDLKGGVIGGSLIQGEFKIGDEIEIKPGVYDKKTNKYEPIITKIISLSTGAGLVDTVKPGGLIAIGTQLDPGLTKSDLLIGNIIGRPNELPELVTNLDIMINLFETAVGTMDEVKVEPIKEGETLRLNIGTAVILVLVNKVKNDIINVTLRRPIPLLKDSRIAISRRIADRWRLIGAAVIKN